ncbi:hypothetical protein, partial [Plasmodium yoelii yoelii]
SINCFKLRYVEIKKEKKFKKKELKK